MIDHLHSRTMCLEMIKKSLENAALVNYERLSEEAKVEGNFPGNKPQQSHVIFFLHLHITM